MSWNISLIACLLVFLSNYLALTFQRFPKVHTLKTIILKKDTED